MQNTQNHHRKERGQSLVEFTVAITFMLILLAGVIDLGRALFTYTALRDAAQEGAVYGSVYPTNCSQIEGRIRSTSNTPVDLQSDDIQVVIEVGGTNCSSAPASLACLGNEIKITVIYDDFVITMPFLGTILGTQTLHLRASVADTILSPSCN
ncbi:MAG: pilus assembly protein [Chloroflexi bacterium]|nr:pilus assembly protein [Chloroflexota bacterium]